ncbi:hypothetical protein CDD83_6176 [Cordyceps sp. RAO-2017]|nr:hypothetical protein CDD83_6176 [Cordyceps sp. RAO-2017]
MTSSLPPSFSQAFKLIDDAHAQDPTAIDDLPQELHYARSMSRWLETRCPLASPELQLACRAHHFRRWELPRSSFPMTRPGYLTWRAKQKSQAASKVVALLASPTISPAISPQSRDRVAALVRKEGLSTDGETQILEDVACLVFLDDQLDDFAAREDLDEAKMVTILRKTWNKMTETGRQLALGMTLSDKARLMVAKALQEDMDAPL